MHCNVNTKLFYISSVLISKVKAMADNTGRERGGIVRHHTQPSQAR